MKRVIKASESNVKLKVKFEPYTRFGAEPVKTATVSGTDLLDALCKMVDRMGLYLNSEEIRDEGYDAEEVLESIAESNGDGCDYIIYLDNLTTGDRLIEGDYEYEEEDWDD